MSKFCYEEGEIRFADCQCEFITITENEVVSVRRICWIKSKAMRFAALN